MGAFVLPRLIFRGPFKNHFFSSCLLMILLAVIQAKFLASFLSSWLQVDLLTIYVVYIAFEYGVMASSLRAFVAALLLHALSPAPQGFFMMYYLLILVIALGISRIVVMHMLSIQSVMVFLFFVMKYALYTLTLYMSNQYFVVEEIFKNAVGSIMVSSFLAGIFFEYFGKMDSSLKFSELMNKRKERLERL
jgi:hypothetical protein